MSGRVLCHRHATGSPQVAHARDIMASDDTPGRKPAKAMKLTGGKAQTYKWLMPGFLPEGTVTLLTGEKATGKSTILSAVAAAIMGGPPVPGGKKVKGKGGAVCWLTREESYTVDLAPRLTACGAKSLTKLSVPVDPADPNSAAPWLFPRDLPALREWVARNKIRLLVMDPLASWCDPPDAMYQPVLCRPLLEGLMLLARSSGCAIVPIVHVNKDESASLVHRTSGAVDLAAVCRCVLRVMPDTVDPAVRYLTVVASNIAAPANPLKLRIVSEKQSRRIEWMGEVQFTTQQLAERTGDTIDKTLVKECAEWLMWTLTDQTSPSQRCNIQATAIKKMAEQQGFSVRTLWRAKALLGVKSKQIYDDKGNHFRVWFGPAAWPQT